MNAPLLVAVSESLVAAGWNVVRFNFRGIGASEGTPSDGTAEGADAQGALSFASERFGSLPTVLAGWSFGASVAVRTATDQDVAAVIAIAPPVEGHAGYSIGLPGTVELTIPLLVISGANDKETAPDRQREWAERNDARYVALRGANHFFWGKYDDLAAAVTSFLVERLERKDDQAST